jgi:hypothetical protein
MTQEFPKLERNEKERNERRNKGYIVLLTICKSILFPKKNDFFLKKINKIKIKR